MSFEILIHDDLSVADLIQLHKNNGVVLKTPHIGNIYPNNLAMASLGIPMLFYDRTIGNKDRNFHPHKIIYNGTSEIIANPDVISVGSRIIACPQNFKDECRIGANMVDLHMTVMKKVFPSSPLFTYSEYLSRNKKTVLDILKIISKSHPELWERIVDEKGYVHKKKVGSWSEVESMGIYGISNPESGWLIPNVVNILFHGTIDASEKRAKNFKLKSLDGMSKKFKNLDEYTPEALEMHNFFKEKLKEYTPEKKIREKFKELNLDATYARSYVRLSEHIHPTYRSHRLDYTENRPYVEELKRTVRADTCLITLMALEKICTKYDLDGGVMVIDDLGYKGIVFFATNPKKVETESNA